MLNTEPRYYTPCHLLIPKGKKKVSVVICLQGHSPGMHLSLNRFKNETEKEQEPNRDWDTALRAVGEGYAAIALEQRAFGECENEHTNGLRCHLSTMQALLLGRTLLGERCWDVMKLIDVLDEFDRIETANIACIGNSGGGTVTYFVSCLDERINIAMPSCYVCNFQQSIFNMYHCECNFVPDFLKYFELEDLSCLIAPRKMLIVAGKKDDIFLIDGVHIAYDAIRRIYTKAGAEENCMLVLGEDGHRFYADLAFPVFNTLWDA